MAERAERFRRHGPAYRAQLPDQLRPRPVQAREAIAPCRTAALGGHVYGCERCQASP
jgi:Transposase zinc-binding domain